MVIKRMTMKKTKWNNKWQGLSDMHRARTAGHRTTMVSTTTAQNGALAATTTALPKPKTSYPRPQMMMSQAEMTLFGKGPLVFQDETVPTNSGATGAAVLKTGTNIIARKIIGGTDIEVIENTDDITINYDGTPYGTETTVVALVSDGTDISCRQLIILAVDDGPFVP